MVFYLPSVTGRGLNPNLADDAEAVTAARVANWLARRLSGSAVNRITVALGQRDSDSLIVFREPESVRGIELSTYGIPTLVNEKEAFKD